MSRLRDFYLTLEPYMLLVRGGRPEAVMPEERFGPSGCQLALTAAGMVTVANSVVIGACADRAAILVPEPPVEEQPQRSE